jgi:hypothetical protein
LCLLDPDLAREDPISDDIEQHEWEDEESLASEHEGKARMRRCGVSIVITKGICSARSKMRSVVLKPTPKSSGSSGVAIMTARVNPQ